MVPGADDIAAKYRDKIYTFCSTTARDSFLLQPQEFLEKTGPLKVCYTLDPRGPTSGSWFQWAEDPSLVLGSSGQRTHLWFWVQAGRGPTSGSWFQPPALRLLMLGARGSGKSFHGSWLARQLGVFHIQFRERLQELILAKTQSRVVRADEAERPEKEDLTEESGGTEAPHEEEPEVSLHRSWSTV